MPRVRASCAEQILGLDRRVAAVLARDEAQR